MAGIPSLAPVPRKNNFTDVISLPYRASFEVLVLKAVFGTTTSTGANRDTVTVAQGSNRHQAHRRILKEAVMIVSVG